MFPMCHIYVYDKLVHEASRVHHFVLTFNLIFDYSFSIFSAIKLAESKVNFLMRTTVFFQRQYIIIYHAVSLSSKRICESKT